MIVWLKSKIVPKFLTQIRRNLLTISASPKATGKRIKFFTSSIGIGFFYVLSLFKKSHSLNSNIWNLQWWPVKLCWYLGHLLISTWHGTLRIKYKTKWETDNEWKLKGKMKSGIPQVLQRKQKHLLYHSGDTDASYHWYSM